jgi:hypothetical protein
VAAQLKQELGLDAELVHGNPGEFTVWVGDAKVSEKRWARFPDPGDVVAAVRAHAT